MPSSTPKTRMSSRCVNAGPNSPIVWK
jgi:hypothetical protein